MSCLYVEALTTGARLHREAGFSSDAKRWQDLSTKLRRQIRNAAWDERAGLFREGAVKRAGRYSHHTQAGAINAGVANGVQTKRILRQLWTDEALIRSHSMQSFYVSRALERTGSFGAWHEHLLNPWRSALQKGLTTWPEYPDPSRSDSHAWAAWPAVDYVTTVLGIRPLAPGWDGVRLAPQVDGLEWAKGEVPSPKGKIKVEWRKRRNRLEFSAQVPTGLVAEVALPSAPLRRFTKGGSIEFSVPLA